MAAPFGSLRGTNEKTARGRAPKTGGRLENGRSAPGSQTTVTHWQCQALHRWDMKQESEYEKRQKRGDICRGNLAFGQRTDQAKMIRVRCVGVNRFMKSVTDGQNRSD